MRVLYTGTGNARVFAPRDNLSSVLGLADEATRIDGLSDDERAEMLQAGMAAAARRVRDEAKKRVRVKTGGLRRSIKLEVPHSFKVSVRRGVARREERADFARVRVKGPHWYLIEFGRKAGYSGSAGFGTGRYPPAPPYPYLNPALLETQDEQFDRCIIAMRSAWIRVVRNRANLA